MPGRTRTHAEEHHERVRVQQRLEALEHAVFNQQPGGTMANTKIEADVAKSSDVRSDAIRDVLTRGRRRLLHVLLNKQDAEEQRFALNQHERTLLELIDAGALRVEVTEDAIEALAADAEERGVIVDGED